MKIIENNILPPRGYKATIILNMIFVRYGVKLSDQGAWFYLDVRKHYSWTYFL